MYDLLRTHSPTHAAGNAFFLIHFRDAILIQGYGTELADRDTIAAAHAAILAQKIGFCGTFSLTGHHRRAVRKFLLDRHIIPSFHMEFPKPAGCIFSCRPDGNTRL